MNLEISELFIVISEMFREFFAIEYNTRKFSRIALHRFYKLFI